MTVTLDRARAAPPARWRAAAYVVSVFASAFLMFMVQPLVGRMLLPRYGGTAAVWNTALVFFQVVLLIGYAYAHWSLARWGLAGQARRHLVVVLVPLAVLPLRLWTSGSETPVDRPALTLLVLLSVMVGAPFLALAANSSLVQRWFAALGTGGEPYRLYAASNLGSVLGLIAYPFVIEPLLGVRAQAAAWTVGYVGFALLAVVLVAGLRSVTDPVAAAGQRDGAGDQAPAVGWGRRTGWAVRAGVAVSLLMSTTTQITTEVAPVPLLWVVPLLVYLTTFIVAFAWPDRLARRGLVGAAAIGLAAAVVLAVLPPGLAPLWLLMLVALFLLGAGALLCHADLARDRPAVAHLTAFYLWVSLGGAVGGVLNSLVAPVVFDWLAEYPLTLVAVAIVAAWPPGAGGRPRVGKDQLGPALIFLAMAAAAVWAAGEVRGGTDRAVPALLVPFYLLLVGMVLTARARHLKAPVLRWAYAWAVLLGCGFATAVYAFPPDLVAQDRSFFGARRVIDNAGSRVMLHGSTAHGAQVLDPLRRDVPQMYYHPAAPMGRLVAAAPPGASIGMVGLGTGALAVLAEPGQQVVFYEIDPLSERMARQDFTYLADSAADVSVVIDDGRLALTQEPDGRHDLIIVDAFNSDAVPVHLLTAEAMRLYLRKLEPGGIVAFHISNRYLDLTPVVAGAARAAGGAAATAFYEPDAPEREDGAATSRVVAVSSDPSVIDGLVARGPDWVSLDGALIVTWTDDHVNLLPAFRR